MLIIDTICPLSCFVDLSYSPRPPLTKIIDSFKEAASNSMRTLGFPLHTLPQSNDDYTSSSEVEMLVIVKRYVTNSSSDPDTNKFAFLLNIYDDVFDEEIPHL
jgi:hypothetical protein